MIYSNIDFSVVYVDPSAQSGGDGTTPAAALNALSTLNNNTCYIIRRTAAGSFVTLPKNENVSDTLTHICFFGMPKSTDRLWELVPDAVRTAWGNDEAEYANLCADFDSDYMEGGYLDLPSIRTFMMYRCHLFRNGNNSYNYVFNATNNSGNTSFLVEQCRFGLPGAVLEDNTYTGSPSGNAVDFLYVKSARVFAMRSCIVYSVGGDSMGYGGSAVQIDAANYIAMQDIQCYALMQDYMMGSSAIISITADAMANYDNLAFHILQDGSASYIPSVFYAVNHRHCRMSNVTLDIPERTLGSGTPTSRHLSATVIQCTGMREFKFEKFNLALPKCWYLESGGHVLHLAGYHASNFPGGQHEVSNITVQLAEANGLDSEHNGIFYNAPKSSDYSSYAAVIFDFNSADTHGAEHATANNITINHPRGVALFAQSIQMQSVSLKGTAKFSKTQADITSLSTYYPGYALWAKESSTVRVRNLALTKASAGYTGGVDDPAIGECTNSLVYVDTANAALQSNQCSTENKGNQYAAICGNETDTGHFVHRTPNCICDTWGVNRTGGAPACFKLWNNSCNTTSDMSLGRAPFLGVQITPEATGRHNFICYAAAKNQPDMTELATRLIVQVTVPRSDGSVRSYYSGTDGQWASDTESVWNSDNNLSAYKLTLPLDVATTGAIDIKVHFNWYSAQGYVYLDPKFVLQAVE